MASVERRERATADGRVVVRYVVRWRDPQGAQKTKSFGRRAEAERFRHTIGADVIRGHYIDPAAGRVSFRDYADAWLQVQTFDPLTAQAVAIRLRLHAYPVLGDKRMASIKPSTIQSWLRGLDALAWTYRRVIFANVSTVFSAAVDDEVLAKNPCKAASVRAPRGEHGKVTPWTRDEVLAVRAALPDRYRIVVALGAGLGLRQGEIFGLSPDDVDFLRGRVEVRRQVKLFNGNRQAFGPPKGGKTRIVPLPESVRAELAAHLKRFPPIRVTLPTGSPDGPVATESLVISSRERKSLNRNYFNSAHWRKALAAAGLEPSRTNGCHALRHFYASTLLDAGESIKAVSQYLGHADPGFTLRTYTHLMPASDERTRRAVDEVLGVTGVYQPGKTPESPQVTGGLS